MATKSNISIEHALAVIDKVTQELGLLRSDTSACYKIQGPTNKHRMYVFKSKTLGKIDTTLPVQGQPGTYGLSAPNGAIACHVDADLVHLETYLRMLGDAELGKQESNKPRPFAATRGPKARSIGPVVAPIPEREVVEPTEYIAQGGTLDERLASIKGRARAARIRRYVDEHGLSEEEAREVAEGNLALEDVIGSRNRSSSIEAESVAEEAGIEYVADDL